jgi:hypothetical protein
MHAMSIAIILEVNIKMLVLPGLAIVSKNKQNKPAWMISSLDNATSQRRSGMRSFEAKLAATPAHPLSEGVNPSSSKS